MSSRETGRIEQAIVRDGRPVRYRRGQPLFSEGDRGERVFVIQTGWVVVSRIGPGGREIVLAVVGPGDVLGELSILDGQPRSATAIAADEVDAVVAPSSSLVRVFDETDGARELLALLARRLRAADERLVEFASLTTLGRVVWRLLELGERFGESTTDGITVAMPLSQDQLASWCGASREATVKALGTLRSLQIINTGRRSLLIRDPDALRSHATVLG